jgi:hypothetical protein
MKTEELQAKVLEHAKADVCSLLDSHFARIWQKMQDASDTTENPTAYKVALSLSLTPIGRHLVNVGAAVSYGVRVKDETPEVGISDHPELPLEGGE